MREQALADEATIERGELVQLLFRLGRSAATGVLSLAGATGGASEVLVLRRGCLITTEVDLSGRHATLRLARLAAAPRLTYRFDAGTSAYPPGGGARQLALVTWVRRHLEAQLDAGAAQTFTLELSGMRLSLRADAGLSDPVVVATFDETDQRIVAAMAQPRRLDQLWSEARTPRFRLLTFLYFVRAVGGLTVAGVAADSQPHLAVHTAAASALRVLGVPVGADREAIKRAYRRMARALHPDLQPDVEPQRRRELERRLAEVTAAYAQLS